MDENMRKIIKAAKALESFDYKYRPKLYEKAKRLQEKSNNDDEFKIDFLETERCRIINDYIYCLQKEEFATSIIKRLERDKYEVIAQIPEASFFVKESDELISLVNDVIKSK